MCGQFGYQMSVRFAAFVPVELKCSGNSNVSINAMIEGSYIWGLL